MQIYLSKANAGDQQIFTLLKKVLEGKGHTIEMHIGRGNDVYEQVTVPKMQNSDMIIIVPPFPGEEGTNTEEIMFALGKGQMDAVVRGIDYIHNNTLNHLLCFDLNSWMKDGKPLVVKDGNFYKLEDSSFEKDVNKYLMKITTHEITDETNFQNCGYIKAIYEK